MSSSQLQAHPLPILWHRRRINKPTPHKPTTSEKDLSPFPKSWSVNYSGARADDVVEQVNLALDESADEHMMSDLKNSKTDDSSAYSTISQENDTNKSHNETKRATVASIRTSNWHEERSQAMKIMVAK